MSSEGQPTYGRVETIAPKRYALILDHLQREGAASIQTLARVIGGSQSTVRRDLEHLVAAGYLERAHGGAVLPRATRTTFEPPFAVATGMARAEKETIGRAAAERIQPGQSIIFDSGSTVLEVARAACSRHIGITAVTNDLEIGKLLAQAEPVRVVVPGGTIRPESFTLAGEPGLSFLATVHADVAFVGCHAITDGTLTETSLEIAGMKRAIIAASRRTIVVIDSTKFRPPAFATICEASDVDEVITDDGVETQEIERLQDAGINVSVVPLDEHAR